VFHGAALPEREFPFHLARRLLPGSPSATVSDELYCDAMNEACGLDDSVRDSLDSPEFDHVGETPVSTALTALVEDTQDLVRAALDANETALRHAFNRWREHFEMVASLTEYRNNYQSLSGQRIEGESGASKSFEDVDLIPGDGEVVDAMIELQAYGRENAVKHEEISKAATGRPDPRGCRHSLRRLKAKGLVSSDASRRGGFYFTKTGTAFARWRSEHRQPNECVPTREQLVGRKRQPVIAP
jgi:hypothetical protein